MKKSSLHFSGQGKFADRYLKKYFEYYNDVGKILSAG